MTERYELPDELERCPNCGRFVSVWEGYTDVVPGGTRAIDYCAVYCDEKCAAEAFVKFGSADEPDGESTYHLELNNLTVHFFTEEWQEFLQLADILLD